MILIFLTRHFKELLFMQFIKTSDMYSWTETFHFVVVGWLENLF
jgi:hypothetical protein